MIKAQCVGFSNTPPLWVHNKFDTQQFQFPDLDLDSYEPIAIPQNIRLGHQMEYVFKQLIEYSKEYDILIYNLPVRQGKQTLGEIDFILKDNASQQLIHVELSYKFYLIDLEIEEPTRCFFGPNRRDLFFSKLDKIKNKQFPLLHTEEGAQALLVNQVDHTKVEHQCCFKGQLFKPYGSNDINISPLNNSCIVGSWLGLPLFNSSEFTPYQFYIPAKLEWPIQPHAKVAWKSHKQIMLELNEIILTERAPMVWMKKSVHQFDKFFVVWWD